MEQTLFYVVGIALVVLAVVVSALGLRNTSFPGSRGALVGALGVFVLLVAATATAAVISARDEQEHRENEEAAEAAEEAEAGQEAEEGEEAQTGGVPEQGGAAAGGAPALELTAPEDGSLAFDPTSLETQAGEVTIEFTNPAAIEHDVYIEQDGEDVAESDLVSDGESTEASAELEPGNYVYYCSVPGHREGGMEGTLTVE
jgi:plastocyanin